MTKAETRQLGIEFERRIQTIDPQFELVNKLDTETIYSYLNEYQDKYVQQLFIASAQPIEDRKQVNKAVLSKIQNALRNVVTLQNYTTEDNKLSFDLPEGFMSYISSYSTVSSSYNSKAGNLRNILISEQDFKYLTDATFDEDRIIRYPLISIVGDTLNVCCDKYTALTGINLTYCKKPAWFSILTDKACELPIECFDDIVTGAVETFFTTKYKLGLAQSAQRNRNRRNNQNNED